MTGNKKGWTELCEDVCLDNKDGLSLVLAVAADRNKSKVRFCPGGFQIEHSPSLPKLAMVNVNLERKHIDPDLSGIPS